jgi:hypothetical protein
MISAELWNAFVRRFFPRMLAAMFSTIASFTLATLNVFDVYFSGFPHKVEYAFVLLSVGAALLSGGQFFVIRGRVWGVWVMVALLCACLLASLSTYPRSSYKLLVVISVCVPLFSLLLLNSRRYRQMCRRLVAIRRMRNLGITSRGRL